MKVEIIGLNHQGMGIGRINNKVIFIEHALIGEIVEVEIIKEYKKYSIGKIKKIIKNSKDRCDYQCKYYYKCGGCNIGILSYDKQLEFKKNKVVDIFKRYALVDVKLDIVGTDKEKYRNKIILHVIGGRVGYYESDSNNLVEIDRCIIASDRINDIISRIKNINLYKVNEIMIRSTVLDSMVVFYGDVNKEEVISVLNDVSSIYVGDKLIYGKNRIIEKLGDYSFYISKDSFFQVNTKQTLNLYNQVLEYAKLSRDDRVLDLYCGTGTIGIFLAKYCYEVLGIEINASSVEDAKENAFLNNINNIEFICDNSSIISKIDYKADLIVVDPPRSGLDKVTINTLKKNIVKRIVYVSCNPMTLVRDIRLLSDVYELKNIKLFDMFANDYHVESVVLLERR